ncbi:MAG: gfo/Idh/MocA family oxidoreductase, partial [Planctomycetaceae bacterium]|nr:gfo/Idh/MocA family oxidoreductase [Planctomycetaceae bacterium]
MTARKITRRQFTRTTIAASSLFAAPAILRGRNLNEKLNVAVIGCGGRGASNMRSVESENIVAVCDVNENNLEFA